MAITQQRHIYRKDEVRCPWLLLMFSLPASRASQRVAIWRQLQRHGAVPLRNSGYVLPNTPSNQERFEWLAVAIRNAKGKASVVQVQAIDDLPPKQLAQLFIEARSRDYETVMRELQQMSSHGVRRRDSRLAQLRKRFQEIAAVDFFDSPLRSRVETLLAKAETPQGEDSTRSREGRAKANFKKRVWMTRPRPGIDRVSSAWLIRRFIDTKARFIFAPNAEDDKAAIPFDMFNAPHGFGHHGEDCTFETLCKEFRIRDSKVARIAQIIHDADLGDEKFGRNEGSGLDEVLKGWASQGVSDQELLRRGMDLIEGLYHSVSQGI